MWMGKKDESLARALINQTTLLLGMFTSTWIDRGMGEIGDLVIGKVRGWDNGWITTNDAYSFHLYSSQEYYQVPVQWQDEGASVDRSINWIME